MFLQIAFCIAENSNMMIIACIYEVMPIVQRNSIVYSTNPLRETDDYYWRACYRKGMDLYNIGNSFSALNAAFRDVTKAKELYENRDSKAGPADITKEELYRNWGKIGSATVWN